MTDEQSKNLITEWGFKPSVRLVALVRSAYSKGRIDKSDEMSESLDIAYDYIQKSKAYDEIMRIHRETEGEDFMVSISVLRRKIEEIINSNPNIEEWKL